MTHTILSTLIAFTITFSGVARATLIEIGDLNFISDPGNASDGLAFLDMTFSTGMTQAAALANAQLTYADARLATSSEWNDLFIAAGAIFISGALPSDAFAQGGAGQVTEQDAGVVAIMNALGRTTIVGGHDYLAAWSDPDGDRGNHTTRDSIELAVIGLNGGGTIFFQRTEQPAAGGFGWILVSDAVMVPEPSTGLLVALGRVGLGISRRQGPRRLNSRG